MRILHRFILVLVFSTSLLLNVSPAAAADSLEDDFTTLCGWYHSLAEDAKYKDFTAEQKFQFVFAEKNQKTIKYTSLRQFYSALRTTHAAQRYPLLQAYAEGTLGKNWQCPPMQTIMQEFLSLDRNFQYSQQ